MSAKGKWVATKEKQNKNRTKTTFSFRSASENLSPSEDIFKSYRSTRDTFFLVFSQLWSHLPFTWWKRWWQTMTTPFKNYKSEIHPILSRVGTYNRCSNMIEVKNKFHLSFSIEKVWFQAIELYSHTYIEEGMKWHMSWKWKSFSLPRKNVSHVWGEMCGQKWRGRKLNWKFQNWQQ